MSLVNNNLRKPIEFGINMNLLGCILTQQDYLDVVSSWDYFTEYDREFCIEFIKEHNTFNILYILCVCVQLLM